MGTFYSSLLTIYRLVPISQCLWPGLYTEGPRFSGNRAISCTPCTLLCGWTVENPWYSRVKGSIAVTRLLMMGVQNLTPWSRNEGRKVHFRPEKGGNVRVSSR